MTSAAATATPRTTPTPTTNPTRTTTTTTTTPTRLLTLPRTLTLLLLLAAALPPSSPLALPSPNSASASLDKRTEQRDCNNDMEVSAICYNCAALSPKDFHTIHSRCCLKPGPVRHLCVGWYTEDPKEGRRLKYF